MENKNFVWTDELVKEFGNFILIEEYKNKNSHPLIYDQISAFKKSKEVKKDYEILSFQCQYMGEKDVLFNKGTDGYYRVHRVSTYWSLGTLLKQNGAKIYSVKRLSDGQLFELHKTKVVDPNTSHEWVISEITQNKGTIYFNGVWINHVQVVKEPLFTTEDGVKYYEKNNQYLWVVFEDFYVTELSVAKIIERGKLDSAKYFSSHKAAKEYISSSQKRFSLNDVKEVLGKRDFIGSDFLIQEMDKLNKQ